MDIKDIRRIKAQDEHGALESTRPTFQPLLVPEILEAILLQLPLQDLLVNAQVVSQLWHATITSSVAIQQALFFQAEPASLNQAGRLNPLLVAAFPPWFDKKDRRYARGKVFTMLPWAECSGRRAAFIRKDASWRRMFPAQPARYILDIEHTTHAMGGSRFKKASVRLDKGVRMGELYDFAYISVARPISSFKMKWFDAGREAAEKEKGCQDLGGSVKMAVVHTRQCSMSMQAEVAGEFRSEGFEYLKFEYGPTMMIDG